MVYKLITCYFRYILFEIKKIDETDGKNNGIVSNCLQH